MLGNYSKSRKRYTLFYLTFEFNFTDLNYFVKHFNYVFFNFVYVQLLKCLYHLVISFYDDFSISGAFSTRLRYIEQM